MANWGRALTTLDVKSKPYLKLHNGVPAVVYPTIHNGDVIRRVTNATLEDLVRYCDFRDPTIPGYQSPQYAIYEDEQVHPYGQDQIDRQAQADHAARLRDIETRDARSGAPTMNRTSSMQAHRGSHADIRSLYTIEDIAAARKLREQKQKAEAARSNPVAPPSLDRRASQQSVQTKGSRRASRAGSIASSRSSQRSSQCKPQERRTSNAYSPASLPSSTSRSLPDNRQ